MPETDTAELGENVVTHCMGPWHEHEDGRLCGFHNRLGKWATGSGGVWDKECLRDHHSD